jgi:hypothetical protein
MSTRGWTLLLLAVAVTSCVETQTPLALSPAYVLTTVNGSPLPFVVDSFRGQGVNRDFRIVGRSITFLSADSAQYEQASDIVEPLPGDTSKMLASSCFGVRTVFAAYRSFLVLTVDSNVFHPPAPVAVRYDTLRAVGDTLVFQLVDSNRVLRLAYAPGQSSPAVCAPFRASATQRLRLSARSGRSLGAVR